MLWFIIKCWLVYIIYAWYKNPTPNPKVADRIYMFTIGAMIIILA